MVSNTYLSGPPRRAQPESQPFLDPKPNQPKSFSRGPNVSTNVGVGRYPTASQPPPGAVRSKVEPPQNFGPSQPSTDKRNIPVGYYEQAPAQASAHRAAIDGSKPSRAPDRINNHDLHLTKPDYSKHPQNQLRNQGQNTHQGSNVNDEYGQNHVPSNHDGVNTSSRQAEQQAEQCRVYFFQLFIFYLYFVYMIVLVGPNLYPTVTWWGVTICVVFNCSFILMTISFWQCATMDPGEVPLQTGRPRNSKFCVKCNNAKPERTHHCSTCGKCVLNMDHHCPWLANCVGFHNRQFFILILFYGVICNGFASVHGFVYMITTAPYIWPTSAHVEEVQSKTLGMIGFFSVLVLLFFSLVLFVALITFVKFHLGLVFKNATTLETTFNGSNEDQYDLGSCCLNCQQVFGEQWWWWWLPLWQEPLGDGYTWGDDLLRLLDLEERGQLPQPASAVELKRFNEKSGRRAEDHRHR